MCRLPVEPPRSKIPWPSHQTLKPPPIANERLAPTSLDLPSGKRYKPSIGTTPITADPRRRVKRALDPAALHERSLSWAPQT